MVSDRHRRARRRVPRHVAIAMIAVIISVAACRDPGAAPTSPPAGATSAGPGTSGAPGPGASGSAASPRSTTGGPVASLPASGTWARLEMDGPVPAAREDHTWTVAEDARTAYLFGGRDGGEIFDDMWAYDLQAETWTRVRVRGDAPAPRFGHEGVWIPGRGLAIWAGQAGSTFFDDLWLFEPGTGSWQLLPAGGQVPVARYGSCSGLGPDGRLWISHGFTADGTRFADTRAYDFVSGTWRKESISADGPFERCLHACWWTSDGRFALYGGQTTGTPALGDLWFLTPGRGGTPTGTWAEAPAPEPVARNLPAVARADSLAVLFGGRGLDGQPLADTWLIPDGGTGFVALETGSGAPQARSGAAMVYDPARARFVLFGGVGSDAFDDVWELTLP